MTIYKFPENQGKESPKKKPEFIIIDDHKDDTGEPTAIQGDVEYFDSVQKLHDMHLSWMARIFLLSVSLFLILCTIASIFGLALAATLTLITLNQYAPFRNLLHTMVRLFRKLIVFSLGLFVATFSPSFGFGIIALYLLLQGEKINNSFLSGSMFQ